MGIADDVIRPDAQELPINQRLDSHQAYTANVSCVVNGDNHDVLMQFYQDNKTAFISVNMTIEDSSMRDYRCLFATAPTIKPLGGSHNKWNNEQILKGGQDVKNWWYQSDFTLIVYVPHRTKQDKEVIKNYLETSQDSFIGYTIKD